MNQLIQSMMQWMFFCQGWMKPIDDMESDRVQIVEEAWAEIDAI